MNKSENSNEEILSRYINPGYLEEAPEGFTQRTMMRLQSEKVPSFAFEKPLSKYRIAVFYAMITLVLLTAAILLSPSGNVIPEVPLLKYLGELRLPEININRAFSFTLPQLLVYILLGIFILLLFDQVLNRFFHRERK